MITFGCYVAGASLNIPNKQGMTPLHLAVIGRQVNAVKVLLKHNANVNKPCANKEARTPLLEFIATCKLRHNENAKGVAVTIPARVRMNKELEIIGVLF
jgi:hypothetical protein